MQRVRTDRRLKSIILPVIFQFLLLCSFILIDQLTKYYFRDLYFNQGDLIVIDGFFRFTYVLNTGAAWSFLADVSWAQTFFKVLTAVALVVFVIIYVYSVSKRSKWLQISLVFIVSGTLGNFIDRLVLSGVIDFLGFTFGSYGFPIFNFADSFLVVGVIMLIIYYLFMDKNAVFRSNNGNKELSDN